jgi:hypothetical protein
MMRKPKRPAKGRKTKRKTKKKPSFGNNQINYWICVIGDKTAVPPTLDTVHHGDIVVFINGSQYGTVTIAFNSSPFKSGNTSETIKFSVAAARIVHMLTPNGEYDSQISFALGAGSPPDGPSVIVG